MPRASRCSVGTWGYHVPYLLTKVEKRLQKHATCARLSQLMSFRHPDGIQGEKPVSAPSDEKSHVDPENSTPHTAAGLPQGPWRSKYQAKKAVSRWARSGKFFHGWFNVKFGNGAYKGTQVQRAYIQCTRAGRYVTKGGQRRTHTQKCDCKWMIKLQAKKLGEAVLLICVNL